MAIGALAAAFPGVDEDVLAYVAATLDDRDIDFADRVGAAVELLGSAEEGDGAASVRARVVTCIRVGAGEACDEGAVAGGGCGASVEATPYVHRAAFAAEADRKFVAPPKLASWDALPEVTLALILGEWASLRDLVRCARANKAHARAASAVLAARFGRRISSSGGGGSSRPSSVASSSAAPLGSPLGYPLGGVAEWVRGTRLLRGEALPCRRRLPAVNDARGGGGARLTEVRLAGCGLMLVTSGGKTRAYHLGDTHHTPSHTPTRVGPGATSSGGGSGAASGGDGWPLPCVIGGGDLVVAHAMGGGVVRLAVSSTAHASAGALLTFDVPSGNPPRVLSASSALGPQQSSPLAIPLRPLGVAMERSGNVVSLDMAHMGMTGALGRGGCGWCCACPRCEGPGEGGGVRPRSASEDTGDGDDPANDPACGYAAEGDGGGLSCGVASGLGDSCRAGCGVVVVTATSQRSGKRTVVKLRCSVSLRPLKAVPHPLEVFGGRPFSGAAVWGAGVALAGADADLALTVWRPAVGPFGGSRASCLASSVGKGRSDECSDRAPAGWLRCPVGPLWPRRSAMGDVELRSCGEDDHRPMGGASGGARGGASGGRQLLLVWSRQPCPHVSVWQAGDCVAPLCSMRLALAASGELLTSYTASDPSKMRSLNAGAGVGILAGAIAGELLLLLTSDGCLRAWPLDAQLRPAGCVPPTHDPVACASMPTVLMRLRWTLRPVGCSVSARPQAIDVLLHGTHSLPPLPLHSVAQPPSESSAPADPSLHAARQPRWTTAEVAVAAQRAYDPGCWEWCSVDRGGCGGGNDRGRRVASDSIASGGGVRGWLSVPGRAFGSLACKCGLACRYELVDTMRGRQAHLSCLLAPTPEGSSRDDDRTPSFTQGGGDSGRARQRQSRDKASTGCGMSVFADEAFLQAL